MLSVKGISQSIFTPFTPAMCYRDARCRTPTLFADRSIEGLAHSRSLKLISATHHTRMKEIVLTRLEFTHSASFRPASEAFPLRYYAHVREEELIMTANRIKPVSRWLVVGLWPTREWIIFHTPSPAASSFAIGSCYTSIKHIKSSTTGTW